MQFGQGWIVDVEFELGWGVGIDVYMYFQLWCLFLVSYFSVVVRCLLWVVLVFVLVIQLVYLCCVLGLNVLKCCLVVVCLCSVSVVVRFFGMIGVGLVVVCECGVGVFVLMCCMVVFIVVIKVCLGGRLFIVVSLLYWFMLLVLLVFVFGCQNLKLQCCLNVVIMYSGWFWYLKNGMCYFSVLVVLGQVVCIMVCSCLSMG